MRDAQASLLLSRPIGEMRMDQIDPQYVTRVLWYLEQELRCQVTPLSSQQGYLIRFPAGTVEEIYAGQSTQWTYRTTIRFLDGRTLTKYVQTQLSLPHASRTLLAFPTSVLEGPEPSTPPGALPPLAVPPQR